MFLQELLKYIDKSKQVVMSVNHNHAMFIIVSGCECTLLPPATSLTSNKPCPIFGDVECGGPGGRRRRDGY